MPVLVRRHVGGINIAARQPTRAQRGAARSESPMNSSSRDPMPFLRLDRDPRASSVSAHGSLGSTGLLTSCRECETPSHSVSHTLMRRIWINLGALLLLFLVVVGGQYRAHAYAGERANYADEAAHFMNGMLVREYLATGFGSNPMRFAESYYLSYPKVAFGAWPPLFHFVLGFVLLPGWPPQIAALVLLAVAASLTAWRLYKMI